MDALRLSDDEVRTVLDSALDGVPVRPLGQRLLSDAPSGFNGRYFTLVLDYEEREGAGGQVRCFAKAVPQDGRHLDYVLGTRLLQKEHEFFTRVVPILRRFAAGPLPVPECRLVRYDEAEPLRSIVVQEDLRAQGFVARDAKVGMGLEETDLVLDGLGRLHAASWVASQKGGVDWQSILVHPHEALWTTDEAHPAFRWVGSAVDTLIDVASAPDSRFADRIGRPGAKQRLADVYARAVRLAAPSKKFFNFICHGDIWNNNLMFRYDGDGRAVEARIVDFQVYRLVPGVSEALMFIFLNTTRVLRTEAGLERLLSPYWTALEAAARAAGCAPPPEATDTSARQALLAEYMAFGLAAAGGYVPMCQLPPEARQRDLPDAPDGAHDFDVLADFLNTRGPQVLRGMAMSAAFTARVEDALEELLDYAKC